MTASEENRTTRPATACVHLSRVNAPRAMIGSAYKAHQAFWRAFGLDADTHGTVQPFRFRRLRDDPRADTATYLVQSAQPADWSRAPGLEVQSKTLAFSLHPGAYHPFELIATVQRHDTRLDKKLPVRDPRALCDWLERQGGRHGFQVQDLHRVDTQMTPQTMPGNEPGAVARGFRLAQTRFCGSLRVQDPVAFEAALLHGVGPKAAFGSGMLTIGG